jgi:hypothetical protein
LTEKVAEIGQLKLQNKKLTLEAMAPSESEGGKRPVGFLRRSMKGKLYGHSISILFEFEFKFCKIPIFLKVESNLASQIFSTEFGNVQSPEEKQNSEFDHRIEKEYLTVCHIRLCSVINGREVFYETESLVLHLVQTLTKSRWFFTFESINFKFALKKVCCKISLSSILQSEQHKFLSNGFQYYS